MTEGTFKVGQDPTMPIGRCVIIDGSGDITYAGPIRGVTAEMLRREGIVLILNPTDFDEGDAFMRAYVKKHFH